ncbi:MAG: MFS transporter [Spirochaetia bacterium]|nr:MFS transporter [Spirochaetia bacterium]
MFADIAGEMLYPVIPVYLQEIGFPVFFIGLLEGFAEAVAGLGKGYFGNWSDQMGRRIPFIKWGYFLAAVSKPMMVLSQLPLWVFMARMTDRLGKGLRTAPRDALLSEESTLKTKARVFSFHRGWDTLGAMLGPLIAVGFLYVYPGKLTALFYMAFIPGMAATALTFLIKEKPSGKVAAPKRSPGFLSFFKYWKTAAPEYRKLMLAFIAFALFNSSDMLLVLKVKEATGSENIALLVYILFNLVYAVASYPLGILADKLGMKNIFLFGLALFALVYTGMAMAKTSISFYILFGIYGVYMAATEGLSKAWISNLAQKKDTGTAVGLFVSLQSISLMIASAFAGLIWNLYGAAATFALTASAGATVFAFILFFIRKP